MGIATAIDVDGDSGTMVMRWNLFPQSYLAGSEFFGTIRSKCKYCLFTNAGLLLEVLLFFNTEPQLNKEHLGSHQLPITSSLTIRHFLLGDSPGAYILPYLSAPVTHSLLESLPTETKLLFNGKCY